MTGLVMKYFVLNPTKKDFYGEASRKALEAYANSIEKENPVLATDIKMWLDDIEWEFKHMRKEDSNLLDEMMELKNRIRQLEEESCPFCHNKKSDYAKTGITDLKTGKFTAID